VPGPHLGGVGVTGRPLAGHRDLRLGSGPFAGVAPALLVAAAWFAAAVAWGVAGTLPGGRWMVVHLFTLGTLTTLLVAFSQHFARAVTRQDGTLPPVALLVLTVGVGTALAGIASGATPALVLGAVAVTGVVALSRVRLRRMRRAAEAPRFGWVVGVYERAHEAFLVAALLGAAMGAGLVPGAWYPAVRLAHLQLNVLGWAGLTLLATVVFFGPALLRVRLPADAERRAGRALRVGAPALLTAGLLLALPPAAGAAGTLLRLGAAVALAAFAWPVLSVTRAVVGMARSAHPCAARVLLPAALGWFSLAVLADVAVVAAGAHRLLPALGLAVGLGVLLQLILAVVLYLLPSLRGRGFAARDALIARTEIAAVVRALVYNAAVAVLVLAAAGLGAPAVSAAAWTLVLAVVGSTAVLVAWPVRPDPTRARSSVARRYRTAEEPS
jgi:hypothetical protein